MAPSLCYPSRCKPSAVDTKGDVCANSPARKAYSASITMPDHGYFANLIWQIADLLRGPYRPPQYERVMLPMTVLRRFDCVLAPTEGQGPGRTCAAQRWQGRGRSLGPAIEHGRRPALSQPLPPRLREAQGRPRQHREAPRQLHQGLLEECARHLRLLRVRERDRTDARGEHPLPRRLEVLRRQSASEHGTERADGASSSRTSSAASTNWPTRPRATTSRRARSSD